MALRSGQMGRLEVNRDSLDLARQFVLARTDPDTGRTSRTKRGEVDTDAKRQPKILAEIDNTAKSEVNGCK